MQEIWMPVSGFEGLYSVSNLGRIKSTGKRGQNGTARILIPYPGKYGHGRVQLCRNGTKTKALVHQLVARAFIGDPPTPDHEVNHIDFDPTNNRVDNLEWVTHRQNILHSADRLARSPGEKHGQAKLTAVDVAAIKERYAAGGISFVKLGALFGVCAQQCHRIVRGERWAST